MASTLRSVANAVVTAFQGIDGSGSYTYDLSDTTDRVQIGLLPERPQRLSVWLTSLQMRSALDTALGRYRRIATLDIEAAVPAAAAGPAARVLAATDLCSDLHRAIEADRTLGGLVLDITADSTGFDGADIGIDGMGIAAMVITAWWHASAGV